MKPLGLTIVLFICVAVLAGPVGASEKAPDPRMVDLRTRLSSLEPAEQKKLIESLKRWRSMSEEERQAIRDRLETYKTLPDEERESLSTHLKRWKAEDPDKKIELKKRMVDLRNLPGPARDALVRRFRHFADLPPAEQKRLSELSLEERKAEFERLFLVEEMARLFRSLSKEEREELKDLPFPEQKERALALISKRKAETLARMPDAMRTGLEGMTRKERGKAEEKFLREMAWRDQMLTLVLPRGQRARFAKTSPSERDDFARRFLEENGPRIFGRIQKDARARIEAAGEDEKPWVLLSEVFRSELSRVQATLLPSQLKSLREAPPQRAWEKTRSFLQQNHRRLMARLPKAIRDEISKLPMEEQARRIRKHLEAELDTLGLGRHQKKGIRDLPLPLMFDAVARLKKGRKGGK